jgi:hypothetical protein
VIVRDRVQVGMLHAPVDHSLLESFARGLVREPRALFISASTPSEKKCPERRVLYSKAK